MTQNKTIPLSEKRQVREWEGEEYEVIYQEDDIRDAVRRLITSLDNGEIYTDVENVINNIKEIFGKELTEVKEDE